MSRIHTARSAIVQSAAKGSDMFVRMVLLTAFATTLAGCSTQPGSILNRLDLTKNETALVGSRQRAILNSPVGEASRPGLVNPERVVCAEPSPDVALAIAQSFGTGLSILDGGQGARAVTRATVEGVVQLGERTQAIQLLRDKMYRACEAYSNGAITGTAYNLIMSKNNDAMVTLMMAGVTGGEFGRSGAAVGGAAKSEASASVSSLFDALQAAEKANDELNTSKQNVNDANETLKDKQKIAAGDSSETAEEQAENDQAVGNAETDLAAAQADVREKQEEKNRADAKARAEITKVAGAGAITTKPTAAVGQVLERMHANYLREDFADEYVTACIVEMGLADASLSEFLRASGRGMAVTRSHIDDGWIDDPVEAHRDRSKEFLKFRQQLATTERYSLLARHCEERLFEFVVFARSGETALEQERIRLEAQRTALQAATTRNEAMSLYKQLVDTCGKLEGEAATKCMAAVTTIVEHPEGNFDLGAVTTIEIPVTAAPRPVIAYNAAAAAKTEFDKLVGALGTTPLPNLDTAKVSEADGKRLGTELKALVKENGEVKSEAATLQKTAADQLTSSKKTALEMRHAERDMLLTNIETARSQDSEARAIAADALALHDRVSRKSVNDYKKLTEILKVGSKNIQRHLRKIDDLKKAIEAAMKAHAASS